jgi:hypothetical protein
MKTMNMPGFALLLVICLSYSTFAQSQPRAVLQPGTDYQITIKKSFAGNNGIKEMIPSVSTQTVTIATGGITTDGFSAEMTVYTPRQMDKPSTLRVDPAVEWKFTFKISGAGEIRDVEAVSGEGEIPPALKTSVLTSWLDEILFLTDYKLAEKNKPRVLVSSVNPIEGGRSEIAYTISDSDGDRQQDAQSASTEPMVTKVGGTAIFDPSVGFFVKRGKEEITSTFVAQDALNDSKVVKLEIRTTYEASIKAK